jgi:Cu2+-exporting ATPase/Cu+-exporting ATPase
MEFLARERTVFVIVVMDEHFRFCRNATLRFGQEDSRGMSVSSSLLVSTNESLTACQHCGRLSPQNFCCTGCEFVYGLLKDQGLDDYYEIRDANPPPCPLPVQPSTESFDFCDDPAFIAKLSRDAAVMHFFLEGLNCTACLWLLEKLPTLCADAVRAEVNMSTSTIMVVRRQEGSFARIAQTLNKFGYHPHPIVDGEGATHLQKLENRRDLIRIGVAASGMMNVMLMVVSLYGGAKGEFGILFKALSAAIATPVLTWCAWPFYKSAWNSLKARHPNIDVPIAAALIAGIVISVLSLVDGTDNLYFDSLSMLVFLLLSSRFWLKRIQQHHLDASHLEAYLLMGTVQRVTSAGSTEKVSSLSLKKDDVIVINDDQVIPADGTVCEGNALVNTAVLTGEATPVMVSNGDRIEAGTKVVSGAIHARLEGAAAESRLARILKEAEQSTRQKPRLVLLADRVSQIFIAVVFLWALATALWFLTSDPYEGFTRALALVIVTCPCVFGMAIPLSVSLGIRGAARHGIILKNGEVLERLSRIKTLFFDKTGTLTKGDLKVLTMDLKAPDAPLACAYALEAQQLHPVARAICKHLEADKDAALFSEGAHLLAEGGLEGRVAGRIYSIRPQNVKQSGSPGGTREQIKARYGFFAKDDATPGAMAGAAADTLLAEFEIGDELKENSLAVIRWAHRHGLRTVLLSGDRSGVVETCGAQLGLKHEDLIAGATPEVKSHLLKESGAEAMMIGDGANDAGALASSSIGIAVRGSMDVSLRAADVYLTQPELGSVPKLFEIARRTRRAIARNLIFSASFNIVMGTLATTGLMSPLLAAVLMPMSSLTVLASALTTGKGLEKL